MDRRAFLTTAVAVGAATALPRPLFAATLASAAATRTSPEKVKLDWEAAAGPASVFVASTPYAAPRALRPLATTAAAGAEFAAPSAPRPYFLIQTKGGEAWTAERLLPLQGGRNFRDLGGYRAAGGKSVRWGKLYRSGVMSGLTPADMTYLSALGVNTICDLRNTVERAADPTPFLKVAGAHVSATDYEMASAMDTLNKAQTKDEAVQAFAASYISFLDILTPQYTDMFARLVAGEAPLTLNCSAGKDRTGVGSALILSVLGVPRETVVADYALTQVYTPPGMYASALKGQQRVVGLSDKQAEAMRRMPPEALAVIMGSDPEVMRLALAQMDAKFGGPVALVKTKFGVTDAGIARMRSLYLV